MIAPVAGIHHVVSLVDGIAGIRPHLPPLVVAVTSADGCDTARGFLDGYHRRLSVENGAALVPHAMGAGPLLAMVAEHATPDVELLDKLVDQLRSTIPPGAGRRWRPSLFETCHDVITGNAVGPGLVVDQRRQLRDHLYNAWEQRTSWLAWIQKLAAVEGVWGTVLGLVATAVFSGPSRWWFGRRLNSRLRWLGEHVTPATGIHGDFLSHALSIVPIGPLHDNAPLRRGILVDALLRDLDRLTRRRRFFPHRRRRRWMPVLSLDCTAKQGLVCLDVVQSFIELTEHKSTSPLLVIAAMEPDTLESAAGPPNTVKDAVELLQKCVNNQPSVLTSRPWLPVLLTSKPEDRVAIGWLEKYRKVTPRVPGKISAWAPVAITTVFALAATVVVTYQFAFGACTDTWTNSLGERVGLSDGTCGFTPLAQDPTGFPGLRELEGRVRANNDAVDAMKDSTGAPRDYRHVVFFAPLTRPERVAERTVPANALWQLQGAVNAQERLNNEATTDTNKAPIKLLLANSGDRFVDGPAVASAIAKKPRTGPGSIVAIIGISQSRPESLEAFEKLRGIAVIGSSMYGNRMTEGHDNFFMISPPNDRFATAMADWAQEHGLTKGYTSSVVMYDPGDRYFSADLRGSIRTRFPGKFNSLNENADVIVSEASSSADTQSPARTLCEYSINGILPVLTGRADQLEKIFTDGDNEPACSNNRITMLAGPGAIVGVASGKVAKHTWLTLVYTALAGTAAESDEGTGYDALRAASEAIDDNAFASGGNPNAQGVLNLLSQGFTANGRTGPIEVSKENRQDLTSDRVKILEAGSNT